MTTMNACILELPMFAWQFCLYGNLVGGRSGSNEELYLFIDLEFCKCPLYAALEDIERDKSCLLWFYMLTLFIFQKPPVNCAIQGDQIDSFVPRIFPWKRKGSDDSEHKSMCFCL